MKRLPNLILLMAVLCLSCSARERTGESPMKKRAGAMMAISMRSEAPPGGLKPEETPMFVSLGFDDNGVPGNQNPDQPEGLFWALEMLGNRRNSDGSPTRASFYLTAAYAVGEATGYGDNPGNSPTMVKRLWNRAWVEGHEIGNHTFSHPQGVDAAGVEMTVEEWVAEMTQCNEILSRPFDPEESVDSPDPSSGPGIPVTDIVGFRTPFLNYTDNTFHAIREMGFRYDCSIEDGFQPGRGGERFFWPYRMDYGSDAHDLLVHWGLKKPLSPHPGLWEMPAYVVIVPPDEECAAYGVSPGFRNRMKQAADYFDVDAGTITGFDYNMWVLFRMTAAEFSATLKYTLDLRLRGNRTPFLLGMHSDMYAQGYPEENVMRATPLERRKAVEAFVDYALGVDSVRMVPTRQVLDWMENPQPVDG